ncbi:hypothetical protein [Bacillus pumilus]|uniref:hypothetical protein n=1 Tax=Bacillus pumilus TaxID=1408 RepID=UPI003D01A95E
MNKYNNFETLDYFRGSIWVTKHQANSEQKGLNICSLANGIFTVLYYIVKTENGYTFNHKKYYSNLEEIINKALFSLGLSNLLEQEPDEIIIECEKCNKKFHENYVNIVDYPTDLCNVCEENYLRK